MKFLLLGTGSHKEMGGSPSTPIKCVARQKEGCACLGCLLMDRLTRAGMQGPSKKQIKGVWKITCKTMLSTRQNKHAKLNMAVHRQHFERSHQPAGSLCTLLQSHSTTHRPKKCSQSINMQVRWMTPITFCALFDPTFCAHMPVAITALAQSCS